MSDFLHSHHSMAQRALFEAGFELAGVRFQSFAERLQAAADAAPTASTEELTGHATDGIEGGALAVIAEEPALGDYRLAEPETSVSEAASAVLCAVAQRLLDAHR